MTTSPSKNAFDVGILSTDEEVLASLGYKQELKRDFSWIELVSLSISAIGIVQSIASLLVFALPYGGSVALVWGWAVGSCFIMTIVFSMAELASAAPTSGGLYYWTFKYSSPKYRRFAAWTVGYTNTIGWTAGISGLAYSTAVQMLAVATIGSNGSYVPTAGQTYCVFCGLLVLHTAVASLPTRFLARLQTIYAIFNVGLLVALIILLPVATPSAFKNDAKFVFGSFTNLSSWPNGFAFFFSFLAPAWTMGGIDTGVHLSEESKHANTAVPKSMVISGAVGCILGWVFILVVAFHMGSDTTAILQNPIGQPMVTILFNSLGYKGTLVVYALIIVALNMNITDMVLVASRQMFAFSRDGALPFSSILYRVHPLTGTPVYCVFACALGAMLLALLSFAGPVAIGAVFTMGIICQYTAYSVPIAARFFGGQPFAPGPFTLGAWGFPVAATALLFMTFMITIMFFPAEPGPMADNMNYSIAVLGGIGLLNTAYYHFPRYGGKYWFKGPLANIDKRRMDDLISEDSNSL